MESKDSSSDCGDADWTTLSRAADSLYNDIDEMWTAYLDKNEDVLKDFLPDSRDAFEDVPLQLHDLHDKYCNLVESKVEKWLERDGCSAQDFFAQCEESLSGAYCALFEEDVNAWFVEYMVAISSFQKFVHLCQQKIKDTPEEAKAME